MSVYFLITAPAACIEFHEETGLIFVGLDSGHIHVRINVFFSMMPFVCLSFCFFKLSYLLYLGTYPIPRPKQGYRSSRILWYFVYFHAILFKFYFLRLWLLCWLAAHSARVTGIVYSDDRKWLLSTGRDRVFTWHYTGFSRLPLMLFLCLQNTLFMSAASGVRIGSHIAASWCTCLMYEFCIDFLNTYKVITIS